MQVQITTDGEMGNLLIDGEEIKWVTEIWFHAAPGDTSMTIETISLDEDGKPIFDEVGALTEIQRIF